MTDHLLHPNRFESSAEKSVDAQKTDLTEINTELLLNVLHQIDDPLLSWVDTSFRAVLPGESVEKERESSFI